MRVLHVDTAATWRGGQNQVRLTARGMLEAGHDVRLACRRGGALEPRARGDGLPVDALPFRGDWSPLAAFRLRGLLRRFRPDALMLHDSHAVSAALLAGRQGARRICVRRVDFPIRTALSRRKYLACDARIAVSQAIAAVLGASGIGDARVVYEGVPDRAPTPGGLAQLRLLGVPEGAPVVGNVAALTDHKDHATLIAAAARVIGEHPEVRFVVVGEGELRDELRAQAQALGLGGRFLFAGFRDDVDRLLPSFDVFCLSSHQEGLGTSLLDAMCFARPTVATAAGGIPEVVEHGVTGLLTPPRDPGALADALLQLLADPARRASMGRAGRARFESRFTAERMVAETLRVLSPP